MPSVFRGRETDGGEPELNMIMPKERQTGYIYLSGGSGCLPGARLPGARRSAEFHGLSVEKNATSALQNCGFCHRGAGLPVAAAS